MRRASTTILSEKDFKNLVKSGVLKRETFSVHITREKNMYLYDERELLVARGKKGRTTETKLPEIAEGSSIFGNGISFSQGLAVVTMVKQQVKSYLVGVKSPQVVEAMYSTTGRDQKVFKEINNGEAFYSVDINHAYFQVLKKLGYITDSFYEMYKDQDHYKKAFHFSCSWLVSRAKIYQYRMGVLIGIVDKKESEKELKIIYDNVRYTLQNLLGELYEQLDSGAVAYLTDEIFVKKEALPFVKEYFKSKGYEFKINLCFKMNNVEFNKANQKVHKLFGTGAEREKAVNQDKIGAGSGGSTEVDRRIEARMRSSIRNKSKENSSKK